jgi:tetratricopeptide (TPR) repeat protein
MKLKLACVVLLGLASQPLIATPVPVPPAHEGKVTATEILNAGYAALSRKELDAAERAFNDARRVIPASPRPAIGLAEVARLRNSPADVARWLELAMKLAPGDADVLQANGRLAIANADWKRAEDLLVKATQAAPNMPSPYVDLGEIYFNNLGQPAKATAAFSTAVKLNPQLAGAQYGLGMSLLRSGNAKAAEAPLREAARLAPQNLLAHLALGDMLSSQSRWQDAINSYSTAAALAPASAAAQLRLGTAYQQSGHAREALAAYDAAVKLDPSLAEKTRAVRETLRKS